MATKSARPKPDPAVFLRAAEELGILPASCIVFEDAKLAWKLLNRADMAWWEVGKPAMLKDADMVIGGLYQLVVMQKTQMPTSARNTRPFEHKALTFGLPGAQKELFFFYWRNGIIPSIWPLYPGSTGQRVALQLVCAVYHYNRCPWPEIPRIGAYLIPVAWFMISYPSFVIADRPVSVRTASAGLM